MARVRDQRPLVVVDPLVHGRALPRRLEDLLRRSPAQEGAEAGPLHFRYFFPREFKPNNDGWWICQQFKKNYTW